MCLLKNYRIFLLNQSSNMVADANFNLNGCQVYKRFLAQPDQVALLSEIRTIVSKIPLYSPLTPCGKPMSVKMTSAGKYGWYSEYTGY
jgi:alkylated DNA repair protein (DNA oxidative demethylase)